MIIDTTNDELLINGQRWQRGGYLQATAYATEQINITARDGRVIGKALQWDAIYDQDKNLFGLNRDGVVTALTTVFNSRVKSPYNLEALRDVEDGTASYGDILVWSAPGEWQYDALTQYHHAYNSEAATLRAGATATTELYYTAQADGDGLSESAQSNTPASGYQIIRKLYYAEKAQQDPDTGTWVQFADLTANTSFNDAKTALLAYLKERTGGTVPISLKMTWEEVEEFDGLLDNYGGAAAAYSVRRLSSAYTGPLIEVERASDSTTQDIGYDSNGDLDTTALATFCSGTTCTVRTWYDQSSNGNDAVQTTQANQPKIYDSSTGVIEEGSAGNEKPALYSNANSFVLQSNILADELYAVVVNAFTSTSAYGYFGNYSPENDFAANFPPNSLYRLRPMVADMSSGYYQLTTQHQIHLFATASNGSGVALNGDLALTGANRSAGMNIDAILGIDVNAYEPTGNVQELIIWDSDQSSNRSGIETNVNDYFGIYTPFTTGLLDDYGGAAAAYSLRRLSSTYTGPLIRVRRASDNAEQDISADIEGNLNTAALASFCSGTDGFVKTWYCQSGNGNDATQTTTANQPKIYDSSTGVIEENGKPAVDTMTDNAGMPFSSVIQATNQFIALVGYINNQNIWLGSNDYFAFINGATTAVRANSISEVYTSPTVSNQTIITYTRNGSESQLYQEGSSLGTSTALSTQVSDYDGIGTYSRANAANFKMQEIVIYDSDQSSNRSGIETNINDFYNIYP